MHGAYLKRPYGSFVACSMTFNHSSVSYTMFCFSPLIVYNNYICGGTVLYSFIMTYFRTSTGSMHR